MGTGAAGTSALTSSPRTFRRGCKARVDFGSPRSTPQWSRGGPGADLTNPKETRTMRFMMLVIPKAYEKAGADFVPPADLVAKMTKYNDSLTKAGVLLGLDGLHPRAPGAAGRHGQAHGRLAQGRLAGPVRRPRRQLQRHTGAQRRRETDGDRRPVHRGQGSRRRLRRTRVQVTRGSDHSRGRVHAPAHRALADRKSTRLNSSH